MKNFFSLKTLFALSPLLLSVALSIFFFFYITPDALVAKIGLENAYALMFSVAVLSGLSTLNSTPYYSMLFVLASAGVNPFLLGVSSALGVVSGDSLSYFVGHRGAAVIPAILRPSFEYIRRFATQRPRLFPLVCLVYGACAPLSNNVITIPAGVAKVPFLRVMVPLALGNIIFNVTLAYLVVYAYESVKTFFLG